MASAGKGARHANGASRTDNILCAVLALVKDDLQHWACSLGNSCKRKQARKVIVLFPVARSWTDRDWSSCDAGAIEREVSFADVVM